jgi:fructokinase
MKIELIAAIEAGGTKFNCALGTGPDDIRAQTRIETTTPKETLHDVMEFLEHSSREHGRITAIGVASFGPLDLRHNSDTYGYITTTPKEGWKYTDMLGEMKECFHVPIGFDTDVNAAALGEHDWGNGKGCDPLVYITVGTGIGGGVLIKGMPHHGALHPEIGHMMVPQVMSDAPNPDGICPYHGNCLEGLISGPAIEARWGAPPETFVPEHACWGEFASLMALALMNLTLTLAPQRFILGGGVMHQTHLYPMIQEELQRMLGGYLDNYEVQEGMRDYVVHPALGDNAGILGAMALAKANVRNTLRLPQA